MGKVALISQREYRKLQKLVFADDMRLNPVVDGWGNFLISEEEILQITEPTLLYLKDLTLYRKQDVQKNLNTTPPISNGFGIAINNRFKWAFDLKINGFTVALKTVGNVDYIEYSVLAWADLWFEINKPQNDDFKKVIQPLINYLNDAANKITL